MNEVPIMFNRPLKKYTSVLVALGSLAGTASAWAYSCESEFAKAESLIKEAENGLKPDTDARIKAMLAEAKGTLDAAKISHRQASEKHTGDIGKYMHGDAVRKGRWAQSLASEVIFLATGKPR
jgi:hypothetical protein